MSKPDRIFTNEIIYPKMVIQFRSLRVVIKRKTLSNAEKFPLQTLSMYFVSTM